MNPEETLLVEMMDKLAAMQMTYDSRLLAAALLVSSGNLYNALFRGGRATKEDMITVFTETLNRVFDTSGGSPHVVYMDGDGTKTRMN